MPADSCCAAARLLAAGAALRRRPPLPSAMTMDAGREDGRAALSRARGESRDAERRRRRTVYVLRLFNEPAGKVWTVHVDAASGAVCSAKCGKAMRVLVVEDEAALRDTLKDRLIEARFYGGRRARRRRRRCSPALEYPLDVAIVDLGLPGLPGLEVIRRLRAGAQDLPHPDPDGARQLAGQGRGPAGGRR